MSDDLGKSVSDRLLHTSQVTAIAQAQIYRGVFPQGLLPPAVAVAVIASSPNEDLNSTDRLGGQQVAVLAWGKDPAQSASLAKVIRDYALPANLRGLVEGMDWKECTLSEGASEVVDNPVEGSDNWRRYVRQVFTIWAEAT